MAKVWTFASILPFIVMIAWPLTPVDALMLLDNQFNVFKKQE